MVTLKIWVSGEISFRLGVLSEISLKIRVFGEFEIWVDGALMTRYKVRVFGVLRFVLWILCIIVSRW